MPSTAPTSAPISAPTIAIVGAGPGLGRSSAKIFGGHGFTIALISRSKDKLDTLVAELAASGITALGFPADVADHAALAAALRQAAAEFGGIDVLEYSRTAVWTWSSRGT
jgi:NAD(P)-dependent dehydrogenase (short-subunit alcohol dehydrogenase family)